MRSGSERAEWHHPSRLDAFTEPTRRQQTTVPDMTRTRANRDGNWRDPSSRLGGGSHAAVGTLLVGLLTGCAAMLPAGSNSARVGFGSFEAAESTLTREGLAMPSRMCRGRCPELRAALRKGAQGTVAPFVAMRGDGRGSRARPAPSPGGCRRRHCNLPNQGFIPVQASGRGWAGTVRPFSLARAAIC
jgi:hypothetical protein